LQWIQAHVQQHAEPEEVNVSTSLICTVYYLRHLFSNFAFAVIFIIILAGKAELKTNKIWALHLNHHFLLSCFLSCFISPPFLYPFHLI